MALVGVSRSVRDNETLLINASIIAHSNVGVIELRDSSHFNALGLDLACDLATAIEHLALRSPCIAMCSKRLGLTFALVAIHTASMSKRLSPPLVDACL
jgi:hypothetical protein